MQCLEELQFSNQSDTLMSRWLGLFGKIRDTIVEDVYKQLHSDAFKGTKKCYPYIVLCENGPIEELGEIS